MTLFTEKFDSPYDIERLCDVCPTAPLHVRTDDSGFVMRLYNNNRQSQSGFRIRLSTGAHIYIQPIAQSFNS